MGDRLTSVIKSILLHAVFELPAILTGVKKQLNALLGINIDFSPLL